jgi:hypothetical protein
MEKKKNKHVLKPLKHGNNMVKTLSKHYKPCLTKLDKLQNIILLET